MLGTPINVQIFVFGTPLAMTNSTFVEDVVDYDDFFWRRGKIFAANDWATILPL
jgi:hypothetical protein